MDVNSNGDRQKHVQLLDQETRRIAAKNAQEAIGEAVKRWHDYIKWNSGYNMMT